MTPSRPLLRFTASASFALLLVLATGLPSHHHVDPADPGGDVRLVSGDHHDHATELVEQEDRVPSAAPQWIAIPPVAVSEPAPVLMVTTAPPEPAVPRLRERPPPPRAPRAPPVRISPI